MKKREGREAGPWVGMEKKSMVSEGHTGDDVREER